MIGFGTYQLVRLGLNALALKVTYEWGSLQMENKLIILISKCETILFSDVYHRQ
jgi:hypothetical protein